jgi:hypothetical protein
VTNVAPADKVLQIRRPPNFLVVSSTSFPTGSLGLHNRLNGLDLLILKNIPKVVK